jgi:hypothetical protein
MSDGKVYATNDIGYTPTGTITGTLRILDDLRSQLIGTLSGTISSSLVLTAATGYTKGKYGTEIT